MENKGDVDFDSMAPVERFLWSVCGRPTECRQCGAPIFFAKHKRSEKWVAYNADATAHFTSCPNKEQRTGNSNSGAAARAPRQYNADDPF